MEYDSRVKYPLNVNHNYDVLGKPNTKNITLYSGINPSYNDYILSFMILISLTSL
jgi:hypothetical protein